MSTSRPNGYTSYRGISRETRPSSAELIDLHVYIVPPEIWRERYNNLLNQNVTETISAGIIRVHPERFVYDLRNELEQQVGEDMLPRDYVFLKSVGRSITRLKQKQEYQLKAKHFIPPQAYAPELYLLEISPDDQGSSRTSTRPHSPFSQNHEKITQVKKVGKKKDSTKVLPKIQEMKLKPRKDGVPEAKREDERRSGNKSKHRHNDSSPYRYSPLPKIKSGHSPTHNRGEYNHNGDIRTENGRLSDSWGSNRDKRTPPPPQNVPRTPQHPKASRDQTPREHTSRGESHRAPPPRSSPTPTDHRKRADQSREPVSGTYTNHTNEDSGINVNSPEDHFDALDRRKHDEDRNNDLNQRLHPDNEDDHHRNGDISDDEWERRRREEEERRRRESEERRMKEDEDRRKEEEERRRLEEERERISKQQLTGSDEATRNQTEDTPLSLYDEPYVNDTQNQGNKSILKDSNVVVQINDEIHGKLTPRVIVHVNSGSSNRTVEEESYRRNRLKVGDTGYNSDWDSRSYRSDGYLSDASVQRNRPPVNDKTFVSSDEQSRAQSKTDRQSVANRTDNANQNGSLKKDDTFDEYGSRNGRPSAERSRSRKEVSWSDGQKQNDKNGTSSKDKVGISDQNKDDQKAPPTIVTQPASSEASQRPPKDNPVHGTDLPLNSVTEEVHSGSSQPNHRLTGSASLDARSKVGTESSFEKSEADTMISNVNSGYQGDVSDIGPDEKTEYRKKNLKDLNRFPSPPPLQMDSNQGQETESSKQNKKAEKAVTKPPFSKQETKQEIKERLMKELEAAREARRAVEKQREELVKKAKLMQTKTQNRRNHDMMNVFDARDLWKKRYFEEKKKTPPLEEQCNRLRHELDIIHRKLMNTLEGPSKEKSTRLGDLKPSQKNNYKIQATRLTHEIDDMRRRLENAKMKLTAEMKPRPTRELRFQDSYHGNPLNYYQ
ncbi:zinc finger CCCH domain-containing protein 13 isoform X6 [Magallana gigas]|uniref:zinc finger CCCH domain-containing protein 13 isoform X6 n=1 Tax=Magallana gigas TaxID=29159 RepID=UPI00333F3BEC